MTSPSTNIGPPAPRAVFRRPLLSHDLQPGQSLALVSLGTARTRPLDISSSGKQCNQPEEHHELRSSADQPRMAIAIAFPHSYRIF